MPEALPEARRLGEIVEAMAGQPVLLCADLVADRFIHGSPKRLSREAPVLILRHERDVFVPGGGANAVANVAALGGVPLPLGAVGAPRAELRRSGVGPPRAEGGDSGRGDRLAGAQGGDSGRWAAA